MSQFFVFEVEYDGPTNTRNERFPGCEGYLKGVKGQKTTVTGAEAPAIIHGADVENKQKLAIGQKPEWKIALISEPTPIDSLPEELLERLRNDAKTQATPKRAGKASNQESAKA